MIVDYTENAGLYKPLHPLLRQGLELLETTEFTGQAPGVYPVQGERLFYIVQEFVTAPPDNTRWEAHQHHTDIQFLLEGEEDFGYCHVGNLGEMTAPYGDDDTGYFTGSGDFVRLVPGMFAVQFPHDAHLADRHLTKRIPVRKIVVKMLLD